ncbi:MAG TPA: hypothetical protein VK203_16400 [Nostocaceae cyanobacterium]|nr:hypothetical protein [Nostocaceae cyanobacterium]
MKRFFSSILVVCIIACASILTGFTQPAFAAHVFLNIKEIQCPTIPSSGYVRYTLSWKSKEFVPSIPEVNEYKQFWPDTPSKGDCGAGKNVIAVNEKFQFPVDLDLLVRPAVGAGSTPLNSFVVPATQNYENTATVTSSSGGYNTIISYKVTFE